MCFNKLSKSIVVFAVLFILVTILSACNVPKVEIVCSNILPINMDCELNFRYKNNYDVEFVNVDLVNNTCNAVCKYNRGSKQWYIRADKTGSVKLVVTYPKKKYIQCEKNVEFVSNENVIHINGISDLLIMENSSASFILDKDIDLKNIDWTPINFYGNLNGNNHVIYNAKIVPGNNSGFFGLLGGHVNNLTLKNINITTEKSYLNIGILAGSATQSQIENIKIIGCNIDAINSDNLSLLIPDFTSSGSTIYGYINGECINEKQ